MLTFRGRLFTGMGVRVAWILMVSAATIHVMDEALTGFLPFYNQLVHGLRDELGFFPMPTFSFGLWLGGLVFAIIIGFSITPLIERSRSVLRNVVTILGILMILNAGAHIAGSIYTGELLPGFWSSPLLLMSAVFLVIRSTKKHMK